MPPIGSRSDDLVLTDTSDEEISIIDDGKSKYPWNNYSKEYLHGKWKDANKASQELRGDKKKLIGEVSDLKRDVVYWKKEASNNLSLSTKANVENEKVRNLKVELLEDKQKHLKVVSELKDKIATQKQEHVSALGVKTMMISKLKMDHQIVLNAEKLKSEKLILSNKNLTEKVAEYKDEISGLKESTKELNKIKVMSIKNKVQLKNKYEKAGIR